MYIIKELYLNQSIQYSIYLSIIFDYIDVARKREQSFSKVRKSIKLKNRKRRRIHIYICIYANLRLPLYLHAIKCI